ncbi:LIM domain-containing protein [Bacillus wiedmannii]|uniref:LIM domain-containing protein n=1 Tax=Bacillus cereus group TaxID=86661 RepID=UPI00399D2F90
MTTRSCDDKISSISGILSSVRKIPFHILCFICERCNTQTTSIYAISKDSKKAERNTIIVSK